MYLGKLKVLCKKKGPFEGNGPGLNFSENPFMENAQMVADYDKVPSNAQGTKWKKARLQKLPSWIVSR